MISVQGSTHLVTPDIADEFLVLSRRQVFLEAARDAGQHGYHAVDVDGRVCHSLQHVLLIWRKADGSRVLFLEAEHGRVRKQAFLLPVCFGG